MNIFSYLDYKKFLKDQISAHKAIYGYKGKLAKAANCQLSFLSQALNGSVHLTPEHAIGLGRFWNLNPLERDYFMALVQLGRTSSPLLRDYLRSQLQLIKQESENLSSRLQHQSVSGENFASVYYSAWHFSAIHILTTIPAYRTSKAIADRLGLSENFVTGTLKELESMQLVQNLGNHWEATQKTLHLPDTSPLTGLNHFNWRTRAVLDSYERVNRSKTKMKGIHYTAVCSLSFEDAEKTRALVLQFIDQSRQIAAPSKEEEVFCLSCDFFGV